MNGKNAKCCHLWVNIQIATQPKIYIIQIILDHQLMNDNVKAAR